MSKHETQKKWLDLPPPLFCNGKKKLAVWDFDGTLYQTPDRPEGEALYAAAMGKPWPFGGWWGRLETLMPPLIPDPPPRELLIEATYQAYLGWKADKDAHNVLMTGRPYKNRKRVQEILAHFDISFDEEYYRGQRGLSFSQDTFEIKSDIIEERLVHDKLECIEVWEDRAEHIGRFLGLLGRLKGRYKKTLSRIVLHDVTQRADYEV
jgi:hypothetical protein